MNLFKNLSLLPLLAVVVATSVHADPWTASKPNESFVKDGLLASKFAIPMGGNYTLRYNGAEARTQKEASWLRACTLQQEAEVAKFVKNSVAQNCVKSLKPFRNSNLEDVVMAWNGYPGTNVPTPGASAHDLIDYMNDRSYILNMAGPIHWNGAFLGLKVDVRRNGNDDPVGPCDIASSAELQNYFCAAARCMQRENQAIRYANNAAYAKRSFRTAQDKQNYLDRMACQRYNANDHLIDKDIVKWRSERAAIAKARAEAAKAKRIADERDLARRMKEQEEERAREKQKLQDEQAAQGHDLSQGSQQEAPTEQAPTEQAPSRGE